MGVDEEQENITEIELSDIVKKISEKDATFTAEHMYKVLSMFEHEFLKIVENNSPVKIGDEVIFHAGLFGLHVKCIKDMESKRDEVAMNVCNPLVKKTSIAAANMKLVNDGLVSVNAEGYAIHN
jgi:hypothetical protein